MALASGLRSALAESRADSNSAPAPGGAPAGPSEPRALPTSVRLVDTGPDLIETARIAPAAVRDSLAGLLVGSVLSGPTALLAAAAEAARVPLLSPVSEDPRMGSLGEWVFSSVPLRAQQGADLARLAAERPGSHQFAVLVPEDSEDESLSRGFLAALPESLRASARVFRYKDALKIGRIAQDLRSTPADALLLDAGRSDVQGLVSQLAYYEVRVRLLGAEELRPSRLPFEMTERFDGSVFAERAWAFDPPAASDPVESWKAEAARAFEAGSREAEQAGGAEVKELVERGYAAGRIAAWLAFHRPADAAAIQRLLREFRMTPGLKGSSQVLEPPAARLRLYVVEQGKPRLVR
jgi:ABC-type branched-subunit amino acid transport system substrate-binding protein